jgi:hypothetical protein
MEDKYSSLFDICTLRWSHKRYADRRCTLRCHAHNTLTTIGNTSTAFGLVCRVLHVHAYYVCDDQLPTLFVVNSNAQACEISAFTRVW